MKLDSSRNSKSKSCVFVFARLSSIAALLISEGCHAYLVALHVGMRYSSREFVYWNLLIVPWKTAQRRLFHRGEDVKLPSVYSLFLPTIIHLLFRRMVSCSLRIKADTWLFPNAIMLFRRIYRSAFWIDLSYHPYIRNRLPEYCA